MKAAPVLAGVKRFDDGMTGRVAVARSMFVGGRVAATDVAAGHAETQVHPNASDPKAIFTALGARLYRSDLIEV